MATSELELLIEARTIVREGRAAALRKRAGLSQGELARVAKVDQATVSRYESAGRTPRGDSAVRYARALRRLAEIVERRSEVGGD